MTESTTELAKKEFKVIRDLLLVPLKPDSPSEELPEHRKWKGGCIPVGLPDLVPFNTADRGGVEGFCKRVSNKLVFTVKNKGNAKAPKSITRVIFFPREKPIDDIFIDTPEIPAGETFDLPPVNAPQCIGAANSSCQFVIIVNAEFTVIESDLTNNVAIGMCRTGTG